MSEEDCKLLKESQNKVLLAFLGSLVLHFKYSISSALEYKDPLSTNKAAPVFYGAFLLFNNIAPT